jgi:hypothetical protein
MKDEVEFLSRLGSWNVGSERTTRRAWLLAYQTAMPLRAQWGSLDREQVAQVVDQALKEMLCP